MTSKPYQPVDCGQHSLYEQFIIQGTRLRGRWHQGQAVIESRGCRAVDIYTRDGEEFITLSLPDQAAATVRLDRIIELRPDDQPGRANP